MGCHVANTSLKTMLNMEKGDAWQGYKDDWKEPPLLGRKEDSDVWSVWSKKFAEHVSRSGDVESVIALGSVLAISLRDEHAG